MRTLEELDAVMVAFGVVESCGDKTLVSLELLLTLDLLFLDLLLEFPVE